MSIKGLDVSSFQHPNGKSIDFAAVKAAGYDFVLIKATEGVGYVNPFLAEDIHGAHRAGLPVGVYTFLRRDTDPVAAANKLDEVLNQGGYRLELPIGLDFEAAADGTVPTHHQLDTVRTVLKQHGHRTMTYSYASFITEHIPADCAFCAKDPLWLAAYQATEPPAPKPWSKVKIWQRTSRASVPGVPSAAEDGDVFEGDQAAFDVFIGKSKPAPALPGWYHRLLSFPPSKLRNPGHVVTRNGVRFQEGEDVKTVQRKLGIRVDGLYGDVTANHVKGFERLHKLTVDGVVGPDVAKRLG